MHVSTQWLGGMEPWGLNLMAAFKVAEVLGVEETPALLSKLKTLEMEWLKRLREEATENGERGTNSSLS